MPFHVVPLAKAPTRMAALLSPLLSSAPGNAPNIHDSSNSASSCYSTPSSVAVFDCRPAARLVPRSSSIIFASASFSSSSASFSVSGSTALAGRGLLAFSSPAPAAGAGVTDRRTSMTTTTPNASSATAPTAAKSIHDFTVKDINGEEVDLSGYKGKVLLVVNVASACGLTSNNYKELQEVYAGLKESGLEILAFPCNQFGGQEPGSNEQIKEFACTRFKAEYPIFDKVEVNGPNTAPVYQFLKASKGGGILGDSIKWNFAKFLVDQDGIVVERYAPTTSPKRIEGDIKKLLGV